MKKFSRIFLCCILVIVVALTAVACTAKDANGLYILKAPKATLNGNTISWNPVKNAKEYGVVIDGALDKEVVTTATSFPLMNINRTTTVKVRSIGDQKKYANSDYSAEITFDPKVSLTSPSGVALIANVDKSIKITWLAVENASSYLVYTRLNGVAVGEPISVAGGTLETTIPATSLTKAGAYMFSVKAIGGDSHLDSIESNSVAYTIKLALANPQKVLLGATTNNGTISFKKVENAEKYLIRAMKDGVEYKILDNPSINSEDVTLDVKKFDFKDVGLYTFEVKATRKNTNSSYYFDSEWVQVKLKKDETKSAEMRLYPAPTNVKITSSVVAEANVDLLTWDAVEGAKKYSVELKSSASNQSLQLADKAEYDLTKSDVLNSDNNTIGGRAVSIRVFVAENMDDGILPGLTATAKEALSYQSSKVPDKKDTDGAYLVENLLNLAYIAKEPNAKYRLNKNINAGSSQILSFTDTFGGEFDGANYAITNFTLVPKVGQKNLSLFGNIQAGGVVKNLSLYDNNLKIKDNELLEDTEKNVNCAFVANNNAGTIMNITINSSSQLVDTEGEFASIALSNSGTIKGCSIIAKATAYGRMAGITVENSGTLFNNMVYSSTMSAQTVQAKTDKAGETVEAIIGGIVAVNSGKIEACGVSGLTLLTAKAQGSNHNAYAGGLVGKSIGGSITKSYVARLGADGDKDAVKASGTGINSLSFAGGLIGLAENTAISSVYNQFMATTSLGTAGGLIGQFKSGTLDNCYSIVSKVTGITKGGFIGVAGGTITNAFYDKSSIKDTTTKATSQSDSVAGLTNITKKEELAKLNLVGFKLNINVVDNYMILSDIPYLDKQYGFSNGTAKKGEERKSFAKFYLGDQTIDTPTHKASIDTLGTKTDVYVMKSGEVEYVMTRIIKINS